MFTVPSVVAAIVLLVVRALLTVAFFREALLKLKDLRAFARTTACRCRSRGSSRSPSSPPRCRS